MTRRLARFVAPIALLALFALSASAGNQTQPTGVRSVTGSAGVIATTTGGAVAVSADTTVVQARIVGCGTGSAIQTVDGNGSATCLAMGGALSGGTPNLLAQWSSSSGIAPIAVTDDTTTTGTCNDYPLAAGVLVLRSNCATLTGVQGGVEGRLLLVMNEAASTNEILQNENAGSTTAADRLTNSGSQGYTLNNNGRGYAAYVYNGATSRWQMWAISPVSGTIPGTQGFTNATFAGTVAINGGLTISNTGGLSFAGIQHIKATGTAPTLSSCGTSPTVTTGDPWGTIVAGTGATTCTMTFAGTFGTNPSCLIVPVGGGSVPAQTLSPTAITWPVTAGAPYSFFCGGH